jgi:hypothetical protein
VDSDSNDDLDVDFNAALDFFCKHPILGIKQAVTNNIYKFIKKNKKTMMTMMMMKKRLKKDVYMKDYHRYTIIQLLEI